MHWPVFLLFASDAMLLGIAGAIVMALAFAAGFAERRRVKRVRIDRVGWMPWTTLSVFAFLVGAILLWLALQAGRAG